MTDTLNKSLTEEGICPTTITIWNDGTFNDYER